MLIKQCVAAIIELANELNDKSLKHPLYYIPRMHPGYVLYSVNYTIMS
jgi:hypothetical protein